MALPGMDARSTPDPDAPILHLEDVQGAFVHGCTTPSSAHTFCQIEGEATRDISFVANHLPSTSQVIRLGTHVLPETITGLEEPANRWPSS